MSIRLRASWRAARATLVAAVLPFPVALCVAFAALMVPPSVAAQEPGLKLAIGDVGLGLGDVPRLDGIRLNFRDQHLERVRGLNVTVWTPYEGARGVVQGVALGLPGTGAARITGLALGGGVSAEESFDGIGLGLLGLGAGQRVRGIAVGGLGVGGGGDLDGLMVGGLGVGTGGDVRGVVIGGVGAGGGGDLKGVGIGGVGLGVGGSITGLAVGGVGVGASGAIKGIIVGGVGVGASGPIRGIMIGGVGVGAGDDVVGLAIGGVGVGAGGDLKGLAVGGAGIGAGGHIRGAAVSAGGIGARELTGLAVAPLVGGSDVRGLVIAPGYMRIADGGSFRGVGVSAFHDIRGRQHGLTIGIVNIADELHGVQLGLINIARNKASFRVLPLVNYSR